MTAAAPEQSWAEALKLLSAADRGEIPYGIGVPWSYCGTPTYLVGGWQFAIFDDCGSWDYIDYIITPDGDRLEAESGDELFCYWSYRPTGELDKSYNLQMKILS